MSCVLCYWILLDFTGFYQVGIGFYWVLLVFYWVLLGFTRFHWVLPGFTGFYQVSTGFYWVRMGSTVFLGFPFNGVQCFDGISATLSVIGADAWPGLTGFSVTFYFVFPYRVIANRAAAIGSTPNDPRIEHDPASCSGFPSRSEKKTAHKAGLVCLFFQ